MGRDVKPTPEDISEAIEAYGSRAHLARALGVPVERLRAWQRGEEPIPLELYRLLIDLVSQSRGE